MIRIKKRYSEKYKKIDKICLALIGVLFFTFSIINFIGPGKKDFSEREKRALASFPKFSIHSLADGSFTSGVNDYFNDHFLLRDNLIDLSKKLETLYGVDYSIGDGNLVILDKGDKKDNEDEAAKLREMLEQLSSETETDPAESDPPETEPDPIGTYTLSKTEMKLTEGSGTTISVLSEDDVSDAAWSIDDSGTIELTSSEGGKANIKAVKSGEGELTCKIGTVTLSCKISVKPLAVKDGGGIDVDFMTNGLFIYGDAVYSQGYFDAGNFSNLADVAVYYKQLFSPKRVTLCIGPTSGILLDNDSLRDMILDQRSAFDSMISIASSKGVNCPDVCEQILSHRDEYLYYKTDHHWTDLGAYYAYCAFARSVGFEPTPLENFEKLILNEAYQGSMYDYTQDERVKSFFDTVEAYMPTKAQTMTINTKQGDSQTYDSSIMTWSGTYAAFLCGDNPYTVINVPENPQDLTVLVLKDSFGNALIPFLSEHYGNIFVVDVRYADFNIKEAFSDYSFTDVLFINNIEAACSPAWPTLYLGAVGAGG